MSTPTKQETRVGFDATLAVDRGSRVKIPLTALGAFVGGLVAFVATGILVEAFIVLVGALVGWLVGLGVALLIDQRRGTAASASTGERTRDDLYEEAQRLDVDGRSQMSKDELAEAVAEARTSSS